MLSLFWRHTPDYACALLDRQGLVVGWLGAAETVFGYSESDVIGKSIAVIFSAEDRSTGMPELERGIASVDGRAEDDRWHVRKDGARIWISGSLVALRDGDDVIGFAKVMRDRTDLKTQVESLANRVAGMTKTLSNQDAAFSKIVHEIRNSIAPLQSALDVLSRIRADDEIRFPLDVAKRQTRLLERMVRDLAEVARVKSGKLVLVKQHFEVCGELAGLIDAVKDRAQQRRQELVAIVPPTPIFIWADRERFHQIVFNLLDNAIKYTGEGGHVWLKCMVESGFVILKVEDDGIGVPAHLLPLIFNLFSQESTAHSEGGMGVGLSLVKELVEAHGGIMEVRSDGRDKGSEFTVRLPLPGSPR